MNSSPKSILNFFEILNNSDIKWILVRNSNNEIPLNHNKSKDIDLLIHEDCKIKIRELFLLNGIKKIIHPLNSATRIYCLEPFEMYITQDKLLIDITYKLSVKSLDKGQWLPLDQKIQESAFDNSKIFEMMGVSIKILSVEDRVVEMITRAIFNKRIINLSELREVNQLIGECNLEALIERLKLVFFKFTDKLLVSISKEDINLIEAYLKFKDY